MSKTFEYKVTILQAILNINNLDDGKLGWEIIKIIGGETSSSGYYRASSSGYYIVWKREITRPSRKSKIK